jgi:hypothetical protein
MMQYNFRQCISKVNEKTTNALIIQFIGIQHSPTYFGTLKCHNQGVKHDPAEVGVQFRGKRMEAVYIVTGGVMVGGDIPTNTPPVTI